MAAASLPIAEQTTRRGASPARSPSEPGRQASRPEGTRHGDQLGSTRDITNSSQAITDSRETDAFGLTISSSGSTATPFFFGGGRGYQSDAASGLMLLGARYYDPSVGRFISRDPIRFKGGANLYRYASNNPLNLSDPAGTDGGLTASQIGATCVGAFMGILLALGLGVSFSLGLVIVAACVGVYCLTAVYMDTGDIGDAANKGLEAAVLTYISGVIAGMAVQQMYAAALMRCFPAGTPVRTRDGTRAIQTIRKGDYVLTADPATGTQSYRSVVRAFVKQSDTLLKITATNGRSIEATPNHPFWVEGKGFIVAGRIARSDLLADANGVSSHVVSVSARNGRFTVYNFQVEGTHTYYAGAAGWWVHNNCSDIAFDCWAKGGGGIYRYAPPGWDGGRGPGGWNFHDIYMENGTVYDPMRGYPGGVPFDQWKSGWGSEWNDGYFSEWRDAEWKGYGGTCGRITTAPARRDRTLGRVGLAIFSGQARPAGCNCHARTQCGSVRGPAQHVHSQHAVARRSARRRAPLPPALPADLTRRRWHSYCS